MYETGDVFQLCPVGDVSIFWPCFTGRQTESEIQITQIYRNEFKTVFILDSSFRQDSGSGYYEFLCRLKQGKCTEADVDKLRERMEKHLSEDERKVFADSLNVYPTRFLSQQHNM